MKRVTTVLIMLVAVLVYAFSSHSVFAQVSVRYVVLFQGNRIPDDAAEVVAAAGGQLVERLPQVGIGIATSTDPNFIGAISGARGVQMAGSDGAFSVPQTQLEMVGTDTPTAADILYELFQWDIRRVGADVAWGVTSGHHGVVVSVIDTGIDFGHPDLAPNFVNWACYSSVGDCSDVYVHWHGTHVAGTIAATFGGGAVVGVGPNLGLASYNVFEDVPGVGLSAYGGSIWRAILDSADRGYKVINMSLGSYVSFAQGAGDAAVWTGFNRVVDYATRQGVTIVASAGNATLNLNGPIAHIPADLTGVISVGATGIRPEPTYPQDGAYDVLAFYSNFGAPLTLSAPGGDSGPEGTAFPFPAVYYWILSTYPGGWYAWAYGTSMASPHVAGAAGLILSVNPGLNPHQVAATLTRTAQRLGDRQQFGHGMVDTASAVGAR